MKSYVFLYKYRAYNMQNCGTVHFFCIVSKKKVTFILNLIFRKAIVLLCRRQINLL